MNRLLADAIDAHGGFDRWKQVVTIEADLVAAGQLHEGKGSQSPNSFHFDVKAHEQTCAIVNKSAPDRRAIFRPHHVSIETLQGQLLLERHDPSEVWDIDPIEENGEIWRGIRVVLPKHIATHCRAQEFYFGEDMLLRRQDYSFDLAEGIRIANYAIDIIEVSGIKLAAKRRAYLCNKRYEVLREKLMVRLDLDNFRISNERHSLF